MDSVFNYISENLELKKKEAMEFPFMDYGFLYGYGLFETIRVEQGKPVLAQEHLDRMRSGAIILDIPLEYSDDEILKSIAELIEKNDVTEGILNIYLTPGNRTDDPTKGIVTNPFFLLVLRRWPGYQADQRLRLDLRQQSFQKIQLDQFKSLSWMKNMLENRLSNDFDDVVLYDENQVLLETSRSNIIFIKGKTLVVPDSNVILKGVIRDLVIKNANNFGYDCDVREVLVTEMDAFDEMFLTNSLRGVVLVESCGFELTLRSQNQAVIIQEKIFNLFKKE
mgnify:FL=1|tara:strand:+ start:2452 stop:3291 length:840 start_codon:yes stop_codon:yes gene_type:complete